MLSTLESRFREVAPSGCFCSLRYVRSMDEMLAVRQDVPQPPRLYDDVGAMITVIKDGGLGYAATSDLSLSGLRQAVRRASAWSKRSAGRSVADFSAIDMPHPRGEYEGPETVAWEAVPQTEKFDLLREVCASLAADDSIVDRRTSLSHTYLEQIYLTAGGGRVVQRIGMLCPFISATAAAGGEAISRSLGGRGYCRQAGLELLDDIGFRSAGPGVADEAIQLLDAPNCPAGTMDVLLAPDQMILQIHESIGHPLELDRILGDERNFAGTSFVTPEMFGSYRYGSDLLNVTFDPTRPGGLAGYAFDDDGLEAEKAFLIEKGILKRGLGGAVSQHRGGLEGAASTRASGWNRPPIDRMATLNLECGDSTLEEMIAGIERGVYMKTNCSWSIDDSRNKFQFGCEWARLIEDGRLTKLVRKPNYRGVSATFWRNLRAVGTAGTADLLGTPNCGKGEPNQIINVGHASPACVFADVEVFGGE